jgi:hypothetical protein
VIDPFKPYATSKDKGMYARRLDPDRAVWRDSHALFQHGEQDERRRPLLFDQLALLDEARRSDELAAAPVYAFGVFGLATAPGRATVELWRQERLPLPLAYLDSPALTAALGDALQLAEETANALRSGVWALARLLLAPVDDPQARQPPADEVRKLVDHLGAAVPFWARLETEFIRLLKALPDQAPPGPDGEPVFGGQVRAGWLETLAQTARDAFAEAVADVDRSGWMLKAVVRARGAFERELRRLLAAA